MGMTHSFEAKLLEALRQIERTGDLGTGRADDPTSMILRQTALRDDLIRWDLETGAYYLTTTGNARLHRGTHPTATLLRLPTERRRTRRVS